MDEADGRHPSVTPARLLFGSLLLGAAVTVLGFIFGAGAASAAEDGGAPPASGGPAATGVVGGLVQRVVTPVVVAAVPAPVAPPAAAAPAAAPVAPALPQSAGPVPRSDAAVPPPSAAPALVVSSPAADPAPPSSPVASAVTSLAAGVDEVVGAVPIVSTLADEPAKALTQPLAGAVDGITSALAGALDRAVTAAPGGAPPLVGPPVLGVIGDEQGVKAAGQSRDGTVAAERETHGVVLQAADLRTQRAGGSPLTADRPPGGSWSGAVDDGHPAPMPAAPSGDALPLRLRVVSRVPGSRAPHRRPWSR